MRSSSGAVVLSLLLRAFVVARAGSYLTLGIDDCFERVSIGKRLNSSDVTKTIPAHNMKQCSNECERILCNAYSYGVNGNGNGTCLLGLDLPKSGPYDDPDYDLFMKILQCRDRTSCFTKLVGGRRLADKFIQRTLPAESKGECEIYCEYQKEFRCVGFNYRYAAELDSYSSCQMTSITPEKLDLSADFQSDVDYDFYEKNTNSSPVCRYTELTDPYGQRRQWDVTGTGQDPSWQGVNPSLIQKNDVGYGDDKVHYDVSVQPTPAAAPGYNGGNSNNNVPYGYNGVNPTLSAGNRMPSVSSNECFIKARTGHHLQKDNIIKSVNAPSLYGCESMCANEKTFMCNMFSYRYSFTSLMDNCHLSDKLLRQMDVFQDLVPDRDCDVFVRNQLSQPGCQPTRNWDTDCFERIRSGLTFQVAIVKFSVQTENLHECELICLHVKHFTCRVFSFRRGPAVIGKWSDNCYLTDYTILEMDPNKHFVQDTECDIFNRGSYGRGCELDRGQFPDRPWSSAPGQDLTPTVHTTYRPQYGVPPPLPPSQPGYGPKYGPPASPPLQFFPVTPSGPPPYSSPSPSPPPPSPQYFPVRPTLVTPSPPSQYYPVTPTTFVTSTRRTGIYVPSLPPTTFYQMPVEYGPAGAKPSNRSPAPGGFDDLFGPYGQNPTQVPAPYGSYGPPKKLCYINFGSTARLLPSAVKKSINVESEEQCKMECNKARDNQYFRCCTLSYFAGYCELSDIEMRDLKPNEDYSMDQQFFLFTWDFSQLHCFELTSVAKVSPTNNVPNGLEWTWLRFTVNGQPCKSGSYCTKNPDMGIWSCPVDQGGWDYCCKPEHKCGYTEGVSYPWCYVGYSSEQWRPCSDKYYPSSDGKPHTWPVTYIHHSGPPTASVAGSPPVFSSTSSVQPVRRTDDASGNNTVTAIKHEQSLVDQFLAIFRTSSETPTLLPLQEATSSRAPEINNKTASLISSHQVDLPGFRVVDVTDIPQTGHRAPATGSINRLFSYETNSRFRNTFKYRKPYV